MDRAVTVGTGRNDTNVFRILNGDDCTGSENDLFPGLADVDDVDTILTALPNIAFHVGIAVTASKMALGREQHFDVFLGWVKDAWKSRHFAECYSVAKRSKFPIEWTEEVRN